MAKTEEIVILDWGRPNAPMCIQRGLVFQRLDYPDRRIPLHDRCVSYATYKLDAPLNLRPGPQAVHLGFYG